MSYSSTNTFLSLFSFAIGSQALHDALNTYWFSRDPKKVPEGVSSSEEYKQDGEEASKIAAVIPYYKFHGIDRFYDISGIVHHPEIFQLCTRIFAERYSKLDVDFIAGVDARGFILGPPIALALNKPFVMIRKAGKLPNAVTGDQYFKEYKGTNTSGGDELCVSRTVLGLGKRALVIDDLVATGGTLVSACDLLHSMGVTVVECACVVELKALEGFAKLNQKHPDIKVWGLISEDILTFDGSSLEKK